MTKRQLSTHSRITNNRIQSVSNFVALQLLLLLCMPSHALEVTAPYYAQTSYTVSYSGCQYHPSTIYCRLEQRIGLNGQWTSVVQSPTMSATISGQAEGEYFYRAHQYIFYIGGTPQEPEPVIQNYYSDISRVYVTNGPIPSPDPIEVQRQYSYTVHDGDINGDGLTDLYVSRDLGGQENNGSLEKFFLVQTTSGAFSPTSGTESQRNSASSWPAATVSLWLDDVNVDGFVDLFVSELDGVVSGAQDQLVFSPAELYQLNPGSVLNIDEDIQKFLDELLRWYLDQDYFEDNVEWELRGHWETRFECELIWWGDFPEWYCFTYNEWVEEWTPDYSVFHPDAIQIWQIAKAILETGTGSIEDIIDILEEIFGIDIGGPNTCDDLGPELEGAEECRGFEYHLALSRSTRQTQVSRQPGTIWITGRRVLGVGPFHVAIEYIDPADASEIFVFSANQGFTDLDPWTELVGKFNDPPDMPENMFKVGAANFLDLTGQEVVDAYTNFMGNYCDCLDYETLPDPLSPYGYNSHGYIRSLIEKLDGLFVLFNYERTRPGWNKPLPSQCFDIGSCPP